MATINTFGIAFFTEDQSQYPIPAIAINLNKVKKSFPYSPGILAPQAIPSFSTKRILNQEKTSTSSPNLKCVFI